MKSLFIPSSQLGIVEQKLLFQCHPGEKGDTKRKRQVRLREAEQLLKLLGLVPKDQQVHGIAFGVDRLGEYGFWIVLEVPESVRSVFGPQQIDKEDI